MGHLRAGHQDGHAVIGKDGSSLIGVVYKNTYGMTWYLHLGLVQSDNYFMMYVYVC